jgi:hypothetical protein
LRHIYEQSEGKTPSEKFLARLARSSFLSLWSHPNLYTDEGRKGNKGAGQELADLLVVFGDHVLVFSDKDCAFPNHPDLDVSWRRWYTAAVEKSARQLIGAKRWLERFPSRVFKDCRCTERFPIPLPPFDRAKVQLIAVTRGSYDACRKHFGVGATGSLMVATELRGADHYRNPFCIGHVLPNGPFIHVLDEMTVELLLSEFDTVSDFTTYLEHRQSFLCTEGKRIIATGEEELVTAYAVRVDGQGRHSFPELVENADTFMFKEGGWHEFHNHPRYRAKKSADVRSYEWDRLIELLIETGEPLDDLSTNSEPYLRIMAGESRLSRRSLAEAMRRAFDRDTPPTQRYVVTAVASPSQVVYVFVALPAPFGCDTYDEYRDLRRTHLLACCHTAKLRFVSATKIVGIAREPFTQTNGLFDAVFLNVPEHPLDSEVQRFVEEMHDGLGVGENIFGRFHVIPRNEYPDPDGTHRALSPAKRAIDRQRIRNLMKLRLRHK